MKPETHKSLFPYFGGKSKIAPTVWEHLNANGPVRNYVEPFVGSGAVYFSKPHDLTATLNDSSGLMVNLWRAIQRDSAAVAVEASKMIGEADLHAVELESFAKRGELTLRLEADIDHYNTKLAGRYLWGLCNKIGSFATTGGPWASVGGVLTRNAGKGISREIPHLGNAGTGISRKIPHLGDAGKGISREGYINTLLAHYVDYLQHARITCGDWARICKSKSVTTAHGVTGIFLDPPYEVGGDLYADNGCFQDVVNWAASESQNPKLRMVLAGYFDPKTSEILAGWECIRWKQRGGYGGGKNADQETIWVSPQCATKEATLL